jgi:hypothetical protein
VVDPSGHRYSNNYDQGLVHRCDPYFVETVTCGYDGFSEATESKQPELSSVQSSLMEENPGNIERDGGDNGFIGYPSNSKSSYPSAHCGRI